ncbi:autoinducer binding domain-containing protein [Musicola paradisiaca]|uniref:autoinducer binding domain-containing protein n=1 Tax=Musicola paradisiaca TaxID=69223 RepID=UPI000A9C36B1|nr:autoinducer binding domain-containing protein [Musicola paradisiaca]
MRGYFDNTHINTMIKNHLDSEILPHGDVRYAYAIMNKRDPNDMVIINNHASWFTLYLEGSYQMIDPIIFRALDGVEDFPWDEKIMLFSDLNSSNIFNVGRNHNISTGHTFVLHDNKNNLAVLSIFQSDFCEADFREYINERKEKL